MKKLYTLLLMALVTFTVASAQNQDGNHHTALYNAFVKKQTTEQGDLKQGIQPSIYSILAEGGPNGDGCLFDTIYYYNEDSVLYGRYTVAYDASANMTSVQGQEWTGSAWGNVVFNETYTYDGNGNIISYTSQEWDGSALMNSEKTIYTYDGNGNVLTETYQSWTGSTWENSNKTTYTYDVNGNALTELNQNWDGSAWENQSLTTRTYDSQNQELTTLSQNGWDGSAWLYTSQYQNTNTYDGNNNLTMQVIQFYDGSNWINNNRTTLTYDGDNNMLTYLSEYWDGSAWVNSNRSTYTYDSNSNRVSEINENWNTGSSAWENSGATYTTYCNNDCFESMTSYYWDSGSSEWQLNESQNSGCRFFPSVGVNVNTVESSAVIVYPNPAASNLTIETEQANGFYQLQDISGRAVMQGSINNLRLNLNISALGKGSYILSISNGQGTATKKIVKE